MIISFGHGHILHKNPRSNFRRSLLQRVFAFIANDTVEVRNDTVEVRCACAKEARLVKRNGTRRPVAGIIST